MNFRCIFVKKFWDTDISSDINLYDKSIKSLLKIIFLRYDAF